MNENLTKIKTFLDQQDDVVASYLYGSRAEGVARENSDLDIAVFLDKKKSPPSPYGRGVRLAREIEDLVGSTPKIDVRELNGASTFFCFQVLKKGRTLSSRDENLRAEFECQTRNKYFDQKGMYDQFHNDMVNRLKRGAFGVRP